MTEYPESWRKALEERGMRVSRPKTQFIFFRTERPRKPTTSTDSWARHEDGRRSRSEESDDESDTGEKEERETKDKVEGCVQEGHADCRTERGR